ncbi:MAG: phage antirepressor [Selenomonas ruminantium]|uniref:Phage antirepressor n=1 Tax=Selenomonas ruminantium TaxID=971 RepID=A0A927WK10_SELRU|nr:phage antirepressor [Selenomonas ruminantium]MBE6086181.1 phage antirepressor [Selenomonas ruminantium]
MTEIKIWNFENSTVRTLTIDNEPYFVGRDVAEVLGYAKARNAIAAHVDEEDKKDAPIQGTLGGMQEMTVINESGLYSLILGSKLPSAKRFKRWVTSEVLPSIRKHGLYAMDDLIENPDLAINALTALKAEREKAKALENTVAVQNQQIAELRPKASYYDVVLNCKDLVPISTIAKDYGWSAKHMNSYLHDHGIQYKQGDIWLLYQKYAERGYTSTKTHTYPGSDGAVHSKMHTYWTQQGRLFLYDTLKADNILPVMERESA